MIFDKQTTVVLAVGLTAVLWTLWPIELEHAPKFPIQPTVISTGPTVEKLEALEELVIHRVTVSDILTYSDGGTITASWLIRGDGLITISLAQAHVRDRNEQLQTATVVLPQPSLLSARVDHEATVFWDAKQGIWNRINPWGKSLDDIHSRAMKAAQRLVAQAVSSNENVEQARQRAAGLIQRIYAEFGWKITVEWQAPPPGEVRSPSSTEVIDFQRQLDGRWWSLSSEPHVLAATPL